MGFETQTRLLTLGDKDIDLFSDWLERVQLELGIERQSRMRVRLFAEEVLLRMRDHFGGGHAVEATCSSFLGRPRLTIEVTGQPYNPLGSVDSELGSWQSSLCTAIELSPQYAYEDETNTIRLPLPRRGINPVVRIAMALGASLLVGFAGRAFLPRRLRLSIVHILLSPLCDTWSNLLNAISGPIIFLTVVTTLLNARRINERGGSSSRVIARYFAISILTVAFALLCSLPLFSVRLQDLYLDREFFSSLVAQALGTVPANIIEPFATSNTSQLLLIAFTLGFVLSRLGSQADNLKELVRQANMVGLKVAEEASELVPSFTALFLCRQIWLDRSYVLVGIWKPLAFALLISIGTIAVLELLLAHQLSMKVRQLALKLWTPFHTALRSGSLGASFADAQSSCIHQLGIDASLVRIGLPQGLVLYMPVSAIGTIIFTLFAARTLGVQADSTWYASAIIMAVVVFVATPPVPGANLLAYVVLFSALGIPRDVLPDAMIFDIVFGIFAGAANQTLLQLELVYQANRLGLLDKDILHRPYGGREA